MKAIDNCCVVGSACMPGSNRNDQEGEQTQLIMLDQKCVLFKSRVLRTPKKKCKAFFPRRSLLSSSKTSYINQRHLKFPRFMMNEKTCASLRFERCESQTCRL